MLISFDRFESYAVSAKHHDMNIIQWYCLRSYEKNLTKFKIYMSPKLSDWLLAISS